MTARGAKQIVRTTLTLGIQFDDFDYRLFLREYHRDLRSRFQAENLPAYTPNVVLDELMARFEPACADGVAGGRYEALQKFAQRVHRLDLNITGSDFGPFEQRHSPYSYDRAFYHLGREIACAKVKMEFPGYNPYRSTRKIDIRFLRENLDDVIELLPDYLWWSMHDQKDVLGNVLAPEQLAEVRRRVELSGYKVDSFGLYLTTMETLHLDGEDVS
jgi:hypothetical protein